MSFLSILIASIIGSPHCAGMCGGLAVMACGSSGTRIGKPLVMYNLGRLVSYIILGCAAGMLGMTFNLLGQISGISNSFLYIYAGALIVFGAYGIISYFFGNVNSFASIKIKNKLVNGTLWKKILERIYRAKSMRTFPFFLGAASGLLPCGFLWMFAGLAATQTDLVNSMIVMAAFWLGTVPVMALAGGYLTKMRFASFGRFLPLIVYVLITSSGILLIYKHQFRNSINQSELHCH